MRRIKASLVLSDIHGHHPLHAPHGRASCLDLSKLCVHCSTELDSTSTAVEKLKFFLIQTRMHGSLVVVLVQVSRTNFNSGTFNLIVRYHTEPKFARRHRGKHGKRKSWTMWGAFIGVIVHVLLTLVCEIGTDHSINRPTPFSRSLQPYLPVWDLPKSVRSQSPESKWRSRPVNCGVVATHKAHARSPLFLATCIGPHNETAVQISENIYFCGSGRQTTDVLKLLPLLLLLFTR